MKKGKALLLSVLCLLFGAVAFAACNEEHVHKYTEKVVVPTCTEKGYTVRSCACGESYTEDFVDALGHRCSSQWYGNATQHWYECVVCYEAVDAEGHTWNSGVVSVPATVNSAGVKTYTCTECDKTKQEEIPVLAHEHRYAAGWLTDVDSHWKECSVCGKEADAEEHTWNSGVVTLPATVTTTGVKTYTCTECDKTKQEEIPVVPHTHRYASEWITDVSSHWKECSVCGQEADKETHEWNSGVVTQEPTVTATGMKTYTCVVCDKKKYEELPMLPHTHNYSSSWSSDETYHWHACDSCDGESGKTEHTWDEGVITLPATKTATGLKSYTCSVCEKIKTETVPKLPSSNQPVYALNKEQNAYLVVGFDGSAAEIAIPGSYDGLRVIGIYEEAFLDNTSVKTVTLPNTIVSIGAQAFQGCVNLTKINIPDSVCSIGAQAFQGCTSLSSLEFSTELEETSSALTIGMQAFMDCVNLTKVSLAEYTSELGALAFANCYSLTSFVVNENLVSIGDSAFLNCRSLSSLTLNSGLVTVGEFAFSGCEALRSLTFPDTVTSVGKGALRNAKALYSVTLSENMTAIADATFQNCVALQSVELHEDISSLGVSAFSGCTALSRLEILGDVTSFGDNAFYDCVNLTKIYYNSSTRGTLKNENYIFYNAGVKADGIELTVGKNGYIPHGLFEPIHGSNAPKIISVVIEEGATAIDYFTTYNYLPYVTTVQIPASVRSIEKEAFGGCISLTNIKAVENSQVYKTVGGDLYSKDGKTLVKYALGKTDTSFAIPDGVRRVLDGAFYGCSKLTAITVPDSLTEFSGGTFEGCTALTSFVCDENSTVYQTIDGNLYSKNGKTLVRYANGKTDTSFSMPYGVETIESYAFSGSNSLTYVFVGDNVQTIGYAAFGGCGSLEEISLPFVGASISTAASESTLFGYIFGEESYSGGVATTQYYSSYGNSSYSVTYYIPVSLNAVSVSGGAVSYGAFGGCYGLTEVALWNVTGIGGYAFADCSGLTSVEIPASVTSIGSAAFSGCSGLESMTLPFVGYSASATYASESTLFGYIFGTGNYTGGVETKQYYSSSYSRRYYIPASLKTVTVTGGNILYGAFYNCSGLEEIKLLDSVTGIGGSAFYNCGGLTSVEIPASVTSIGGSAFYYCSGLTSIEIPENVTSIGSSAFCRCTALTEINYNATECADLSYYSNVFAYAGHNGDGIAVTIAANVKKIPAYLFSPNSSDIGIAPEIKTVGFEEGSVCESIGNHAFYGCGSLKSVEIPASVTSIGEYAFAYCSSLKSVEIPASVTSVGASAFAYCSSLESITIPFVGAKAGVTDSDAYQYPFGYIFGTGSCEGGTATTQSYYASSTSNVSSSTYYIPTSLKTVTVRGGNILYGAFYNCSDLEEIKLLDSVTGIGKFAFYNCGGLTSVEIPASVTSVGDSAFYGCSGLESVTIPFVGESGDATSPSGSTLFGYIFGTSSYAGGTATKQYYASSWYVTFYIPDSLKTVTVTGGNILYGAFYGCSGLTSITVPASVGYIDDHAFYGCSGLTGITVPASVGSIGEYAFYGCSGLTSITVPASVGNIGGYAFYGCSGLTEVTFEYGVTGIGEYAFYGCASLTEITMPESVTSIGEAAFVDTAVYDDDNSWEDGVLYIGKCLIEAKTTRAGVYSIKDGTVCIGDYAFEGYVGLTEVVIPDSVKSIGHYAFSGCSNLGATIIPESVTSIGHLAFGGCSTTIFCEAESQPEWWDPSWAPDCPVYWYSESKPTKEGNFWHYTDDGVWVIWA